MVYLTKADFTRRVVAVSRQLKPGGDVGPGEFVRRGKNLISSPRLKARMREAAEAMQACALDNACVPEGRPELVGTPVPGKPGKTYVACTPEERVTRLKNARNCAITNLSK